MQLSEKVIYVSRIQGYVVRYKTDGKEKEKQLSKGVSPSPENEMSAIQIWQNSEERDLVIKRLDSDLSMWTLKAIAERCIAEKGTKITKGRADELRRDSIRFDSCNSRKPFGSYQLQDLIQFVAKQTWKNNRARSFIKNILTVVHHFQKPGNKLIKDNPFDGITIPPMESRDINCAPTTEELAKLMSVDDEKFKFGCFLISQCGSRITEILTTTGLEYDSANGVITKTHHKTAHHGHSRVITVPTSLRALLDERKAKYGTELLIPEWGAYSQPHKRFADLFKIYVKKLHLREELIPYGLRHYRCMDLIQKNAPLSAIASIMGHNNPELIKKTYGHMSQLNNWKREYLDL